MTETLVDGVWTWANIISDLVEQGGLQRKDVTIDPGSFAGGFCYGEYKESPFALSWAKDKSAILSMREYSWALAAAFEIVLGYKPYARYKYRYDKDSKWWYTAEWDKLTPDKSWEFVKKFPEAEKLS